MCVASVGTNSSVSLLYYLNLIQHLYSNSYPTIPTFKTTAPSRRFCRVSLKYEIDNYGLNLREIFFESSMFLHLLLLYWPPSCHNYCRIQSRRLLCGISETRLWLHSRREKIVELYCSKIYYLVFPISQRVLQTPRCLHKQLYFLTIFSSIFPYELPRLSHQISVLLF